MNEKMPAVRITRKDIERIKREHILENLSYSVREAADILKVSVRKVYRLIDTGDLVSGNDSPGKRGTVITALSVEQYHQKRIRLVRDEAGV